MDTRHSCSLTTYPPRPVLRSALPILTYNSYLPGPPASFWAAAVGSLRLWLQEVLRVVPPGGCATPPLWVGDEWIFCWDGPEPQALPASPPLYGLLVLYTRSTSVTWVLSPPAPAAVLVAAPICGSCSRPYPHVAAIAALVPQLVLPHAFCVNFKRAPPIMTADIADRCVSGLPGLPWSGALGLTGLSWEHPCLPLPRAEVTNPPSIARATPADPTAPRQPSSGGAYTLYFINLGGAQHHATALPATLEALDTDFVGLQECWDTTRAAALLPRHYADLCGTSQGARCGPARRSA